MTIFHCPLRNRTRRRLSIAVLTGLFAVLSITGCAKQATTKAEASAAPTAAPTARILIYESDDSQADDEKFFVQPTRVETFEFYRYFDAALVFEEQENLYFPVQSTLIQCLVLRGDIVKAGDLLAECDDSMLTAQSELFENNYEIAKLRYASDKKNARTAAEREIADLRFDMAQTEYDSFQAKLEACKLYAPFDGMITFAEALKNVPVGPGQTTITLANTAPDKLLLQVDDGERVNIDMLGRPPGIRFVYYQDTVGPGTSVGTPVDIQLLGSKKYTTGTIETIRSTRPDLNPDLMTSHTYIRLPNPQVLLEDYRSKGLTHNEEQELKIGNFPSFRVRIKSETLHNVLTLPVSVFGSAPSNTQWYGGQKRSDSDDGYIATTFYAPVFRQDNVTEKIPVLLGPVDENGLVMIESGLSEDDVVVLLSKPHELLIWDGKGIPFTSAFENGEMLFYYSKPDPVSGKNTEYFSNYNPNEPIPMDTDIGIPYTATIDEDGNLMYFSKVTDPKTGETVDLGSNYNPNDPPNDVTITFTYTTK